MKDAFFEEYRNVGLRISYFRKLHGFSQMELAELVNISRTHMSRIENAECAVSLDVLFKIADVLQEEAYKFFIYEGLTNTKTSRFQDDMINIIFRVSEDFRGIVIEIKNLSRDKFYIKWGSATISDNHVYIDDIPYKDYMSLGKLRPGESVTKTLREKSLSRIFFDEDILRQNCKLTNNAGYVVRIPITLESGKKIRYKFSIVTGRVDEE